ncbi:DUF1266 domain-containing protein [Marinitenerispora sediminis]|nr:DUF1266 domain-containing protein [Marinitenerispora sediminis]
MDLLFVMRTLLVMAFGRPAKTKYRTPLTTHQLWMVSLAGILAERTPGRSHTLLYPTRRIDRRNPKLRLSESWDITDRASLLSTLDFLATTGHRGSYAVRIGHPPLAWDAMRYADITRYGFAAGYIDERTAWQLLARMVGPVAQTYRSWQAYADDFLLGRQVWLGGLVGGRYEDWAVSQQETVDAARKLLDPANTDSPWQRVPWEAIYRPDGPAPR